MSLLRVVSPSTRSQGLYRRAHIDVSSSATWGSISAEISAGFEASEVLKDFVSSTTEVTREETSKSEYTEAQDYSIGPGDKLYFYQQTFSGPGIYFTLDTTSVTSHKKGPEDDEDVDIVVVSSPVRFIEYMDTAYGDKESDAPADRVRTFGEAATISTTASGGSTCGWCRAGPSRPTRRRHHSISSYRRIVRLG